MAKTIGKEKASLARARTAGAEAEPIGDQPDDEPRDEDIVDAESDEELPQAVADDEIEDVTSDDEGDLDEEDLRLVVPERSAVVAPPSTITHRGMHAPEWMMNNFFLRPLAESYEELRKVSWPTWSEAWTMTLAVIAMSAVIAIILGLADIGLIRALEWIVGLGSTPAGH